MVSRKQTKIVMPYGKQSQLTKMFPNVSREWICKSLNGHSNSKLSAMIRQAALNAGGIEVTI